MLLVATALVALNLRPGASTVGPVLDEIRDGLGMSGGAAGALTGLPGLCFGVGGALAVGLGRRVGAT
ncbi:MFS transporter, partial [Acinetobacter baumannii]|nr:MFS transporter [Acinetobacter baumannii]